MADADPQTAGQIRCFIGNRLWHVVGQLGAPPVLAASLWGSVDRSRLVVFLLTSEIAIIAMGISFWLMFRRPHELLRFPRTVLGTVAVVMLVQGSALLFIGDEAEHAVNAAATGAVVFAVAAGSMVTFGPVRHLSAVCLGCLLLPYAAATLWLGHWWMGVGTLYFLVVFGVFGIQRLTATYAELVELRTQAAVEAARERRRAGTDELTGATNRHGLREFDGLPLPSGAVGMFLDLDRFKPVNDTHGHAIGDEVLTIIGERIQRLVRRTDVVARVGGDEFFILARGLTRSRADRLASILIDAIEAPITIGDVVVGVSASVGVVEVSAETLELDHVIREADRAMYAAKTGGRNRVVWFDTIAGAEAHQFADHEATLR